VNVVDSSGWLEFFADGPHASFFAGAILEPRNLIVPSVSIYEVFKRVLLQRDETHALQAIAMMQQGTVVDLDATLALAAATLSAKHRLPMTDSIMLATARSHGATLWTRDTDFTGLEGVRMAPAR